MSILSNLRSRVFGPRADIGSAEIRRGDGVWEALGGNNGSPSESGAMRVTAVHACVQLIAGAISALPMHVYRRAADGDLQRDMNTELWWTLNEEFSPRWPASAGWSYMVQSKLLHGDGFAEIIRGNGGQIKALVPIHPRRVDPIASSDGMRLVYKVQPDPSILTPDATQRAMRVIDQDDMLHVPGFGFNGLRGVSALRNSLSTAGALAINAQDFSSSFLQNLGRPDYALATESKLTDDQFKRLQDSLETHTGPTNSGKPMILEGGLDIKVLTMPLEEMQLLETRKFQVEEICRAFGVPPFMIGHTEKTSSWGTGVAAMGAGFVRFALRDHLNAFQNEINRKFFRTSSRVAEFDTAELERADLGVMMTAIRTAVGRAGEPSIMSVEEGRKMLRLPSKISGTVNSMQQTDTPADPPQEPQP
ncbi:MAG: phage portal protein [Microgenomates group bacterium]